MLGASQAVQWLGLCTTTAGNLGWIPSGETKIVYAGQHRNKQNNNKKIQSIFKL